MADPRAGRGGVVKPAQMKIMLGVFTEDCVMELASAGQRWIGQAEAAAFYRVFLGSLTKMAWVPQTLVIGPQGVLRGEHDGKAGQSVRGLHFGRRDVAPAMVWRPPKASSRAS